ncbi:MAG: transglycosylase domain-containing protein [Actinomycetota bacterium]|nr:transglycosylase domain-containing protein [Actinomycetota bacterium]
MARDRSAKRARPKSRMQRILLKIGWLIPIGALLAGSGVLVFTYAFAVIPLPQEVPLESATIVYDVNGKRIGIYTGEQRRFLLNENKLDELFKKAPHIGEAVISAEDKDFYEHGGVSLRGLARAAWANVTGGEIQQGGSTISQQYVKNAVLQDPSRTITRKFKEAILAIKLERRYSKKQILGFYLNTIYLGRGAYGIEAAAEAYFDKDAVELDLAEAAYLASIIPSPESYQPDENPRMAKQRRNHVLDVMVEEGYISERKARKASRGKVDAIKVDKAALKHQTAAYFMEWLRDQYLDPLLGSCLYTCGLKVHTTLDLDAQGAAEDALEMTHQDGWPQAALVSMTPKGEIRAMVGGKDFTSVRAARGFNYATTAPGRQPGSAFKPFTLMTAIKQGISPSSRFSGASPATISDPDCSDGINPWTPENYGGSSYGVVDLRIATANSINTVYAQLIAETSPGAVADTVRDFGFRPPPGEKEIPEHCSIALGGSIDVTPLEMARAYAGFNARGVLPEVNPVTFIRDNDNNCIEATGPASVTESFKELEKGELTEIVPKSWADCPGEKTVHVEGERVVEENEADVLNDVMTNVITGGTAASANLAAYEESGKTGTTQEYRDAWFAGSVPSSEESQGLTTVVWMGYPLENPKKGPSYTPLMTSCYDPIPDKCRPVGGISVTGGSYPAQMWAAYMTQAVEILDIQPAYYPTPADLGSNVINSPPPTTDPTPTYAPPPPTSAPPPEEPSEEPSKSEPPPPPPPPTTSRPPPPPPTTSEPPSPPPTSPPSTGRPRGNSGARR